MRPCNLGGVSEVGMKGRGSRRAGAPGHDLDLSDSQVKVPLRSSNPMAPVHPPS